jgi:hypothetical protein
MNEHPSPTEFLVISRGKWDSSVPREQVEQTIGLFYAWLDRLVAEGKMKRGQRLKYEGKTVGGNNMVIDGPFGESKEVVGGYWLIVADSLEEAAEIAKSNPCLDSGLFLEIRPIDPQRATYDNTR